VLHDLPDIAIALIVPAAIVVAWLGGDDDPIWQERRRALSPADRNRIGGVWLLIKGRRTARGLRETISRTPGL